MARLPVGRARPVELLTDLAHQLALGPSEALVIGGDCKHALLLPALALDLLGIAALSAVAVRVISE